jgi:thymidylate synthase
MSPSAVDEIAGPASGPKITLAPKAITGTPPQRTQPRHEEYQYIDLIRELIDHGEHRPDR